MQAVMTKSERAARKRYAANYKRYSDAVIALRLGTATERQLRRARQAARANCRVEHAWLAERDWAHRLAIAEGRVDVTQPAPIPLWVRDELCGACP